MCREKVTEQNHPLITTPFAHILARRKFISNGVELHTSLAEERTWDLHLNLTDLQYSNTQSKERKKASSFVVEWKNGFAKAFIIGDKKRFPSFCANLPKTKLRERKTAQIFILFFSLSQICSLQLPTR